MEERERERERETFMKRLRNQMRHQTKGETRDAGSQAAFVIDDAHHVIPFFSPDKQSLESRASR